MVPQYAPAHAHSRPHVSRPHPDPVRIAGISGTLALNVVALLLLLIPISQPGLLALPDTPTMEAEWVQVREVPPAPPPPLEVEVVRPQPPQPQAQIQQPPMPPATAQPAVVDAGTLPALPTIDPQPPVAAAPSIQPAGPVAGMRLEYAKAVPPPYPAPALRSGLQGTVTLQVLVDVDGSPLEVRVHRSSGHRVLDDTARRHVLRHWSFRPATRDGQPVQAIGLVPIDFNLDRG